MKESLHKAQYSFKIALIWTLILWMIYILAWMGGWDWGVFGLYPRQTEGLKGIIFSPFLHGSFEHIAYNTIPFFSLTMAVFFFYRGLAWKSVLFIFIAHGAAVWVFGRPSYHIGASGLIYGFAAFLFFSGYYRKNTGLLVISLLVIFVYGSMVWGILPGDPHISWEAHLAGALSGLFIAWYYRKKGPQRKPYDWEKEEDTPDSHMKISDYIEVPDPRLNNRGDQNRPN